MRLSVRGKRVGGALLVAFLILNGVAYRQARAFTHFTSTGHRTGPPLLLSWGERVQVLVMGVEVPRPRNRRTPGDVGIPYETHSFPGGRGVELEGWLLRRDGARGTVILFHGHAASKDSQLREAAAFHEMGWNAFLVDFYGSGGSRGNGTSIGFYEAQDVTKSLAYVRTLSGAGPIVLYGVSMGAAAILKAVADDQLEPEGLILECPFDSLMATVRHRFTSWSIPSFPLADLLVFWGGVQAGFNGFTFRPAESASRIERPTLLMNGDSDPWVRPGEAQTILNALRGPKKLQLFDAVGHESCLRRRPDEWRAVVREFLDRRAEQGQGRSPASSAANL